MTPSQHLTWDSRPGADGSTVHLPKYSEVEAAEAEPMRESFTPGPWTYDYAPEPGHASEFMVLGPRNAEIAYVGADEARGVVGAMVEFNARLIAAAPEMYAALMALYAKIPAADVNDRLVEEFLAAEQALIKASGRVYP